MSWTVIPKAVNTWIPTMIVIPAEPNDGYGLDTWSDSAWGSPTSNMAIWTTVPKTTTSWNVIPRI